MNDRIPVGTPEWSKQLQKDASVSAFQLVARLVKSSWEWAETGDKWEAAAENYVQRWIGRWGQIKPLGADHPIPLHQIFVQVRAVPRSFLRQYVNIEEMEDAARMNGGRSSSGIKENNQKEFQPQSGLTIANEHARLNLLWAPGAGKSTFLRRLGLETLLSRSNGSTLRSGYSHPLLPVLIELRSFRGSPCKKPEDIVLLVIEEFANAGFPSSRAFVDAALTNGSLLVLLDGVDEIPALDLSASITAVRDFIDRYPNCRYVLSCRTAFYRDWFSGFHDFILADFDDHQVAAFVHNWFTRQEETEANAAKMFLESLSSPDHRATRELAGSPLLLTFLCLVFRRTQQFPRNRAQLYKEALGIYLKEWNASKFVHNDEIYRDLSAEMELEMLKEIAGPAFVENRYFFTDDELKEAIGDFLRTELNAPKSLSPSQILKAIAVQQGLFSERAPNVWAFSHLTFQEYLAAGWLIEEGDLHALVAAHAADNRWREVFLLMAGLGRADGLLQALMNRAEGLARHIHVFETLSWLAEEDAERLQRTPSAQELAATGIERSRLILRMCYLATSTSRTSINRMAGVGSVDAAMGAMFNALGLNDRGLSQTSEGGSYSIAKMDKCVFRLEFDLRRNCGFPSSTLQAAQELEDYYVLFTLICDCKQAALRVSSATWDAVIARLLMPPTSSIAIGDSLR